jgi:hypothetical protein
MTREDGRTSIEKTQLYEVTRPLLDAMYVEFKELSKKKPEGVVSKAKIKIINRLLSRCREVLKDEMTIEYLDLLEEDDVPQNSDVVLMLSQYTAAMGKYYHTFYRRGAYGFAWAIEGDYDKEEDDDEEEDE